ncbi:phosphatidylinositol-3,4,5-trisphosphate 3-phosphatase PTEN, putative [Entamoeba dispar SAW760]|uniref:Phosphatidylinositol 3,4,5-trisphosphate 3-phosphatase and dual-specificity protein phosphatase PTEN n=1 Tax=Entamoeba dispar (strain ATCC PRA-260 / SAW760) TaxID=370354 RepID=B0EGZ0_ENTDS|nr:phosphatidylinositol-3,4,5-trisphosphate 3-phosphatase PTEN, putative [Entamoeba dispar SAW760]EDR26205.1 phosphatidylinositol-3,4,5-trisphosphate 3-phosphatase PTEN, putative [Entamoeba dispar SAW760]|eukprot:EDR26205.1 phosphatidylinositol-3,4,5-trisphosphate 3-phosphatase PTEN, putative [Entamoeba dispar SAW760]
MLNLVKRQVSQDKRRFQEDGFDLDLTYIEPRIIAMGYPAEGIESYYRNNMVDVAMLLNQKHLGHYRVYNLTENPYDPTPFHNNVKWFPFPDHHNPSLIVLCHIVDDMYKYYNEDPANVVVVHCLAGRGRTGTVITSFLQYIKLCTTPQDALDHFASIRSMKNKGVSMPAQIRYVNYFGELLSKQIYFVQTTYLLKTLSIGPLPDQGTNNVSYELDISSIDQYYKPFIYIQPLVSSSPSYSCIYSESTNIIQASFNPPIPLAGDINIRVRLINSNPSYGHTIVARASFHTYFIDGNKLSFDSKTLDIRNPFKSKVSSSIQLILTFSGSTVPVPLPESELIFLQQFYEQYTSSSQKKQKPTFVIGCRPKPNFVNISKSPQSDSSLVPSTSNSPLSQNNDSSELKTRLTPQRRSPLSPSTSFNQPKKSSNAVTSKLFK